VFHIFNPEGIALTAFCLTMHILQNSFYRVLQNYIDALAGDIPKDIG
jgi:hypothetical protein